MEAPNADKVMRLRLICDHELHGEALLTLPEIDAREAFRRDRVIDLATGDDISKRVLIDCASEMHRAAFNGGFAGVRLLRRNSEGQPYLLSDEYGEPALAVDVVWATVETQAAS